MVLTKLVLALKLGKDKLLLPVGIIQPATIILAEGITSQEIENCLHCISFHNLGQMLILVIDETALEFLL